MAPRLDEAWARAPHMAGRRIGDEYLLVPLAEGGADLDSALNLNSCWPPSSGSSSTASAAAATWCRR